jgi:hypothetical protein
MPVSEDTTAPVIIDHQAHWYPRSCVEALVGRSAFPKAERTANGGYVLLLDDGVAQPAVDRLTLDVEEHVAQATAAGIDTLVFGPATLSEVLNLPPAEAADLLDRIHQEYAAAQRAYPGRVTGLAALPMQDPDTFLPMPALRRYVEGNLPSQTARGIYANRVPGLGVPGK